MVEEQKQLLQQIENFLETEDKNALSNLLTEQRTSDIAEVVELLDNPERRVVFDLLDSEMSAEVLEKVGEATRSELFELLEDAELGELLAELDPDDAADLLAELPTEESQELLKSLEPSESAAIKDLMVYSEDSAGGIMDPVLISVRDDGSVTEAVNKIRAAEIDEDFYSVFVVDDYGRFIGDVRIRQLLTAPENKQIKDLVDTNTIYVRVNADQEQVRNLFSKNDLIVVPVLDENHMLVGRITADRVIEVAEEEAAEDLYTMAGTDADELEKISVFHAARVRMTWLLPCLIGTGATALVLMLFHNKFSGLQLGLIYATAVAFVPMIAAISGNAGLQTSAIVVCGLATGHLAALKIRQVFMREVRVAVLVAISCGFIGAGICTILPSIMASSTGTSASAAIPKIEFAQHLRIVFAFGTGMFSAIMVATTLGLFLPFLFRRIGIDPAISSGPLVTTANDSISVIIYMSLTLLLI